MRPQPKPDNVTLPSHYATSRLY